MKANFPSFGTLIVSAAFVAALLAPPRVRAQGEPETATPPPAAEEPRLDLPEDGAPLPRAEMPEGGVEPDAAIAPKPEEAPPPAIESTPVAPEISLEADKQVGETEADYQQRKQGRLLQSGLKPPHISRAQGDYSGQTLEGLTLRFDGYLRVLADFIEDDERDYVGNNNGFRMAAARIGLYAGYKRDLFGYINLEAAFAPAGDLNDPNAQIAASLQDGFIGYQGLPWAEIWLGRFQMPYDVGTMESTRERTFIDRPLETRGVAPLQGNQLRGMSQGRQLGLMVHSSHLGLTDDGFDLGYAFAVSNGRTDTRIFNDNNSLALFGRLSAHYGSWVTLSGGAFYDQRTVGELPNLFDEDVFGTEGSLVVRVFHLVIEGQVLFQNIDRTTAGQSVQALGWHAQAAYQRYGFELAYRFGWYDPQLNDDEAGIPDRVMEHTLGLSYFVPNLPLRFSVNGTLANEELEIDNNRISLLTQFKY